MTRTVPLAAVLLIIIVQALAGALPSPELMDFGSFHASGTAAGAGLDPYGVYPLTFRVVLPGFEAWNPNLNPPAALPLFQWFAGMDPHDAFRLWWAISLVCHAACVALLARRYPGYGLVGVLWAFALAGFWDTLVLGQIYLPLVLAAVGAWLLLGAGRPIPAGLLIGLLVAVKPNFLVWPGLLLLAGHWRPAAAAAAAAAALNAMALALYGPEVFLQWASLVLRDGERALFLTNASLNGLAQRLGIPVLGPLLGAGVLALLAVRALRRTASVEELGALGLLGAVLASPIAWVHYTLFLLPVFFAAPASPLLLASAALLVVPVPWVLQFLGTAWWMQASVGSVYAWAVILGFIGVWSGRRRRDTPGHGRPLTQSG